MGGWVGGTGTEGGLGICCSTLGRIGLCLIELYLVKIKEFKKKRATSNMVTLFKKFVGPAPPNIASAPLKTAPYSDPFVTLIRTIRIIRMAKIT